MRRTAPSRETEGKQRKHRVSQATQTEPQPPGIRAPIEGHRRGIARTPASTESSTRRPLRPFRTVLPWIHCLRSKLEFPSFNAIDRAAQNHDPIPNRLKESRSRSVRPDRPRGSILRHPQVRPATTWAKTATNSVAPCAYMRTPPLPHREFDPTDPHLAQPLTLGARSAGRGSTFDRLDRRTAHDPTADVESSDFPA